MIFVRKPFNRTERKEEKKKKRNKDTNEWYNRHSRYCTPSNVSNYAKK